MAMYRHVHMHIRYNGQLPITKPTSEVVLPFLASSINLLSHFFIFDSQQI